MQDKIQLTATLSYYAKDVLFGDAKEYIQADIAYRLFEDTSDSLEIGRKMREAGYKELADAWENDKIDDGDVRSCIYLSQVTPEYIRADNAIVFSVTYMLDLKELEELVDIHSPAPTGALYDAEHFKQLLKGVILYTSAGHNTQKQLGQLTAMGFEEADLRYFGFKDQDLAKFYEDEEEEQPHINVDYVDLRLEDLDLSVRAYNCLKRVGVQTVSDIIMLEPEGLRNVRNLGRRAYIEVVNAIRKKTGTKLPNWDLKDDE